MRIVFFGSFQHYSALILDSLITKYQGLITVSGVVTTPPMPVGRKQIITKTPVHILAETNNIPVFTPSNLHDEGSSIGFKRAAGPRLRESSTAKSMSDDVLTKIPKPDFFITAGYGKILPQSWLTYPTHGSLNLHFSLLPAYRGANPTEWAIMCGEAKTGITLITMSDKLDGGDIIAQSEIAIDPTDTRETLYEKLYTLGAKMLPHWLDSCRHVFLATQGSEGSRVEPKIYAERKKQPKVSPTPYAALLKRDDGFIPWSTITKSLQGLTLQVDDFPSKHIQKAFEYSKLKDFLSRLPRALATYPSLWTIVPTTRGDKRMKILSFIRANHASPLQLHMVQLESGQPTLFNQIKNQIINLNQV